MSKRAVWAALCVGLALVCAPRAARAGEFCPAAIANVGSVEGAAATYGVRLRAHSQRGVTGLLLFETAAGWYRAAFPPVPIEKGARGFASAPMYVQLPTSTAVRNVWLAQAASDDPHWVARGVVSCAPDPERHTPDAAGAKASAASAVPATPVAPPLSYACKTPFAYAQAAPDTLDADDVGLGEYASVEIDLDASGNVVDAFGVDASYGDFTLKKSLENRVRHVHFSPAIAYCRPVPSTIVLTEFAPAQ